MHRYKELEIWQKGMGIAKRVYEITAKFPKEEKYGMVSQLNRACVSIPSNIAEGAGRNSNNEFKHFLGIAMGSSCELETQLLLAESFNLIEKEVAKEMSEKILRVAKQNV